MPSSADLSGKKSRKKILEVGVAAGGTSCIIMNCLDKLQLDSELHSVELQENYYRDPAKKSGYLVAKILPAWLERWHLHVGHTVGAFMEQIGGGIDLCILDTAHTLPGEVLDFLTVYPYLNRDAIVFLHDCHLFYQNPGQPYIISSKVLLDAAGGDKMILKDETTPTGIANACSFQLTEETAQRIDCCFSALSFPWHYCPKDSELAEYRSVLVSHYPEELTAYFDRVAAWNRKKFQPKPQSAARKLKSLIRDILPYAFVRWYCSRK